MLQETYTALLLRYTADRQLISAYWQELAAAYDAAGRYYHTADHLAQLLTGLQAVKGQVKDWDAMLFALFYHDIVYDVHAGDNEARSAVLAEDRMNHIEVPQTIIEKCKALITATASHRSAADQDTDLFTDADLSVLGRDEDAYARYSRQVRQEYAVFPDTVYCPGRKAVLARFLEMPRIYKTDYFFGRFEQQARRNLQREHDSL